MKPAWNYLSKKISGQVPDSVHIVTEIILATFVILVLAEFIPRAIFRARSVSLLSSLALVTDFSTKCFLLLPMALSILPNGS